MKYDCHRDEMWMCTDCALRQQLCYYDKAVVSSASMARLQEKSQQTKWTLQYPVVDEKIQYSSNNQYGAIQPDIITMCLNAKDIILLTKK